MKVHQLFESGSLDASAQTYRQIGADCEEFLSYSTGLPVWRGISSNDLARGDVINPILSEKLQTWLNVRLLTVRKNREPMSTSPAIHEAVDEYFNEKFGSKFRSNAVFGTGKRLQALGYGEGVPYLILPVSDFKFAWSPIIQDLFSDIVSAHHSDLEPAIIAGFTKAFQQMGKLPTGTVSEGDFNQAFEDYFLYAGFKDQAKMIKRLLEVTDWYQDTNLRSAIKSENEIMFDCDQYYAIKITGSNPDEAAKQLIAEIREKG